MVDWAQGTERLHGTAQIPSLDQLLELDLYVEDTERLGRDMGWDA